MNYDAHGNIMIGAFDALPIGLRQPLEAVRPLLPLMGNYPDLFDDPTTSDEHKAAIDANWRRYARFPDSLAGPSMHYWPYSIFEQAKHRPLLAYLFSRAVAAAQERDDGDFIKFIGCLSHYFGDLCQPAHLLEEKLLAQLLPPPPHLKDFHYHIGLEAVTGACGRLQQPQLLGVGVEEAAWRMAVLNSQAMAECRAYIVPTLQAIFQGEQTLAQQLAGPPVTRAAQLTLNVLYTALKVAREDISAQGRDALASVDVRLLCPDAEKHSSVYGGAILDGSRDTVPGERRVVPAKLSIDGQEVRTVRGLGVLPNWPDCWMRYSLPPAIFARFEAVVGMHAELTQDGAADFVVELDGQEAFRSGPRTSLDAALPILVDLGQSAEITLKVEDATRGRTIIKNHAIWGEPSGAAHMTGYVFGKSVLPT
jgi:hypothetical protein